MGGILQKPTQGFKRREQIDLDDCDNETCTSTLFLQIQRNKLIDLQDQWKHYCNFLSIFGLNSANFDPDLMKSYLLPILVNERKIEPTVMKKANQFTSLISVIYSYWMLWIFLEAQQVLIPSWRHTKLQRHRDSSPTNHLITPTKNRIENFRRKMLSTVNFSAVKPNTLSKSKTLYWPFEKWLDHRTSCHQIETIKATPLGLRIIITCNRHGSKNNWAHSMNFCGGITKKMLCQLWRQCKN